MHRPACHKPFDGMNAHESETDKYGNPIDGDRLIYCCFPDCGCDGARLCMAEKGPSYGSMNLNIEKGSLKTKAPFPAPSG